MFSDVIFARRPGRPLVCDPLRDGEGFWCGVSAAGLRRTVTVTDGAGMFRPCRWTQPPRCQLACRCLLCVWKVFKHPCLCVFSACWCLLWMCESHFMSNHTFSFTTVYVHIIHLKGANFIVCLQFFLPQTGWLFLSFSFARVKQQSRKRIYSMILIIL